MVCTWLSENEFERYSKVEDPDVNEVFQMVRKFEDIWFIDERVNYINRLFRKPIKETTYTIHQVYEFNGIVSKPEVRIQLSVSTKQDVLNFLYGLNVGYHFNKQKNEI